MVANTVDKINLLNDHPPLPISIESIGQLDKLPVKLILLSSSNSWPMRFAIRGLRSRERGDKSSKLLSRYASVFCRSLLWRAFESLNAISQMFEQWLRYRCRSNEFLFQLGNWECAMLFKWAILLGIKYFERFLVFFETRCLARINERDITMRKKKKNSHFFRVSIFGGRYSISRYRTREREREFNIETKEFF